MKGTNFEKFAKSNGVSGMSLDKYQKTKGLFVPKSMTPSVIEERQLNVSTISVFDRLMMDKIIFLGTEIDDYVANIINAQLLFLDSENESEEPIWLYINSPGGSVVDALSTMDIMNAIKTSVYSAVIGTGASMAFILAISGEKKHRYMLKNSKLLLHQPLGGLPYSQATDIDIYNKEMQSIKQDLIDIVSRQTGQPKDKVEHDMSRDYWMKSEEARDYGAIDKILLKIK